MAFKAFVSFETWLDPSLQRTFDKFIRLVAEPLVAYKCCYISTSLASKYVIRTFLAFLSLQNNRLIARTRQRLIKTWTKTILAKARRVYYLITSTINHINP